MISLEEMPEFIIPTDGHYLVQRKSDFLGNLDWFTTRVTKHLNVKTGKWSNAFGCSGGRVTHISDTPLKTIKSH